MLRLHCGSALSSKGYRQVTFRSLFGNVPLRVRRFVNCPCRDALPEESRSFSALPLEGGMAPELAYMTAKFAALAPLAKVADLLAKLLPVGGAVNAGMVRIELAVSANISRDCVRREPQCRIDIIEGLPHFPCRCMAFPAAQDVEFVYQIRLCLLSFAHRVLLEGSSPNLAAFS
jgi:hypothetical protein